MQNPNSYPFLEGNLRCRYFSYTPLQHHVFVGVVIFPDGRVDLATMIANSEEDVKSYIKAQGGDPVIVKPIEVIFNDLITKLEVGDSYEVFQENTRLH